MDTMKYVDIRLIGVAWLALLACTAGLLDRRCGRLEHAGAAGAVVWELGHDAGGTRPLNGPLPFLSGLRRDRKGGGAARRFNRTLLRYTSARTVPQGTRV